MLKEQNRKQCYIHTKSSENINRKTTSIIAGKVLIFMKSINMQSFNKVYHS